MASANNGPTQRIRSKYYVGKKAAFWDIHFMFDYLKISLSIL